MVRHSFSGTMTFNDRLGDWLSSGATMALRDRVQLLPPVAERHGVLWSEQAVQTGDFEVQFSVNVTGPRRSTKDGMFAFWISPENFTASYDEAKIVQERNWTRGLELSGLTLVGVRPTFKGLGMVFSSLDADRKYKPSITGMWNDAGKPMEAFKDFPKPEGTSGNVQTKYLDYRRAMGLLNAKVRVRSGSVVGTVQIPPSKEWVEVFRMPVTIQEGSFFGFSGLSGTSGPEGADEVALYGVSATNFDSTKIGEEDKDILMPGESLEEWMKVLEEEKKYIDQKSQKDAIQRLSKLLKDHVEGYNKIGQQAKESLSALDERLSKLDVSFSEFLVEAQAVGAGFKGMDISVVKSHVSSISQRLKNDKTLHDDKINKVHQASKELKEKGAVSDNKIEGAKFDAALLQADKLSAQLSQSSSNTNYFLIVLLLAVAGLGFLFMNRMRYYEKKHVF